MAMHKPTAIPCRGARKDRGGLLCAIITGSASWRTLENACWVSVLSRIILERTIGLTCLCSHLEVNEEHNGNLFFWHFQNRHIANSQRTVIWLNGGPGCSSMDGALMEIGPYRLTDEGQLRYNDGSWDEFANILFVDNPVGTGFSYVDTDSYVHELNEMADQMVTFLKKFFALFPEYEDNDVSSSKVYSGSKDLKL